MSAVEHPDKAGGLPDTISRRLKLPLIAAPMLRVSGVELVTAACKAGVIGAFPTANPRSPEALDDWLSQLDETLTNDDAPYCPNLIMRRQETPRDIEILLQHNTEIVITSVGSPAPAIPALHEAGVFVLADVATIKHAKQAVQAGVDGLVLLTAGAGGNTGWLNPFAFVRAVRSFYHGPIALAGGMSDGVALRAARELGADLGYMGTKFIATQESAAEPEYKRMLVDSTIDDVLLTRAFTGMNTSFLLPSIEAAGLDPDSLDHDADVATARAQYGSSAMSDTSGPRRWTDIWSAGHTVSGVSNILTVQEVVDQTAREFTGDE